MENIYGLYSIDEMNMYRKSVDAIYLISSLR